ncbi:DNA-directed RNA polymerase subunit M, partial [bacterium]|nr:DNA-directed RNA polymerase subunit M [bacterium]
MICPNCRAVLNDNSESLACPKCGYTARLVQGIP